MKNPFAKIHKQRENRAIKKEIRKKEAEASKEERERIIADYQTRKKEAEKQLEAFQEKLTAIHEASLETIQNKLTDLGAIDSSEVGNKLFAMDKIKKQAIEVEVKDGERSIFVKGRIVDKYFLEYRLGRKKTKIIIVGPPENFERVVIPHLIVKRGIQYTHIKGEAYTHDPYITSFDLIQVKMILGITEAVSDAKMYEEIAHASRGRDKKEQAMWMILVGVLAIVGMLSNAGYFK